MQAGLFYTGKFLALFDAVIPDDTVQLKQFRGGFHIDLYAAQRVDDFDQLLKIHCNVFSDVRAEILVDGADSKARSAEEIGGVELVLTMAVNIDERIAHQADELDLAARIVHGDNHHAVRMALGIALAGIQTKQCNIGDVFIRFDAGRQILPEQRAVIGEAENDR